MSKKENTTTALGVTRGGGVDFDGSRLQTLVINSRWLQELCVSWVSSEGPQVLQICPGAAHETVPLLPVVPGYVERGGLAKVWVGWSRVALRVASRAPVPVIVFPEMVNK